MAKKRGEFDFEGITITSPANQGSVQRAGDPGPADPLICHIEGTLDYEPFHQVEGIKVVAMRWDTDLGTPGSAEANKGEPFSQIADEISFAQNGVDVPTENIEYENGSGTWWIDLSVAANIDRAITWNHIVAYAQASSLSASFPDPPQQTLLAHHQFKAEPVNVGQCPDRKSGKERGKLKSLATRSPAMLPPLEVTDGWIRYSFFSLTGGSVPMPPINGFQLASPDCCDKPLQARSIAIAAGEVEWRPNPDRHLVISRPYGIVDTARIDSPIPSSPLLRHLQFETLPMYCLLIHQLRHSSSEYFLRIPVDTDCRDRPLRIQLDPAKPFFVQVNNIKEDRTKSDGKLDFWVKVLS